MFVREAAGKEKRKERKEIDGDKGGKIYSGRDTAKERRKEKEGNEENIK